MSYEELLSKSTEREPDAQTSPDAQTAKDERSPEEIKNDFCGIISAYRVKKGVNDG